MASDSPLEIENGLDEDQLRLEQIQLEAKAARLEAEAKALEARLNARRKAGQARQRSVESFREPVSPKSNGKPAALPTTPPPIKTKSTAEPAKKVALQSPPLDKQPSLPDTNRAGNGATATTPRQEPIPEKPATAPSEQGEESLPVEARGSIFSRLLLATPSYLVSAVVHLVILLVLAMIMLPPPEELVKQLTVASALEEKEELAEVIIDSLEQELEQIEFEEPIMAQAIEVADPGAADLGAVAQDIQAQVSDFEVAMNDTEVDSIGALFGSDGQGMADTMAGAGGAEFFGVKASGRKFVFIVDSSLSMKNGKFEAACEELMYSVSRLSQDQYFYVLFFDKNAAKMTFDGNQEPEQRAVVATPANINKLGRWVSTVELELQTNPYDCVEYALSLYPDAIYILTDGKFTDRGRTVRYLAKENLYKDPIDGIKPKIVIHTVGFYQRDGETTLKPLAEKHGGTYRFVPPPGKKK